jgi:dethiobiotin synthetase
MKHKQIFISGIDTDCGKTYITGLLAYHIRKTGVNCITSKLVQTGCTGIADDIIEHRRIMEMGLLPEDENGITCPFVYSFPASPHLSSEIDQRPFEIEKVSEMFSSLQQKYELVLLEGAGGLAVPLTNRILSSEYLKENKLPLVLVSSSKLGSINHTLLSIDYCMNNNIELKTVVYNQFPDDNKKIANSSYEFLKEFITQNHPELKFIHSNDLQKNSVFKLANLML